MKDDFLEELLAEGTRVGTGCFTLDVRQALEKMRSHRFRTPESYLLHLVAAAHLAEASWIRVAVDSDDVVVAFDGRPLEPVAMQSMFSDYFAEGCLPLSRQLVLAMLGASRHNPKFLYLESAGHRLSWGEGVPRLEAVQHSRQPSYVTRFWLRSKLSIQVALRLLPGAGDRPEKQLLRERCSVTSTQLSWNGESLTSLPLSGPALRIGHPPLSGLQEVGRITGLPGHGWVLLDGPPTAVIQIVQDGILFEMPDKELPPSVRVTLWNPGLPTDLGLNSLVEGEAWKALVQGLQEGLARALLDASACDPPFTFPDLLHWFAQRYEGRWSDLSVDLGSLLVLDRLNLARACGEAQAVYVGRAGCPTQFPDGTPIYQMRPGLEEAAEQLLPVIRWVEHREGRCAPTQMGVEPLVGLRILAREEVARGRTRVWLALADPRDWHREQLPQARLLDYGPQGLRSDQWLGSDFPSLPGGLLIVTQDERPGRDVLGQTDWAESVGRLYFQLLQQADRTPSEVLRPHLSALLGLLSRHPDPRLSQLYQFDQFSRVGCYPNWQTLESLKKRKVDPESLDIEPWEREALRSHLLGAEKEGAGFRERC